MKNNNFNGAVIILGAVMGALFGASYFLYSSMGSKGQHIFELSQQSAQNVQYQQQIKNLIASLNTLAPQINAVDSYLVPADGEVLFIEQIESAAKADNLDVEINSVQIQKSKDLTAKGLEYLSLKVTTNGTWSGTYRFSKAITNMPYRIFIDQADIALVPDQGTTTATMWQGIYDIHVLKKSDTNQSTNQL